MGFFKKLFKLIAIVIAIIAVVALIAAALMYAFSVATFTMFTFTFTIPKLLMIAAVGLMVSAIISPEGFREVMDTVGDAASRVVTSAGRVVGTAISSVGKGLLGAVPIWLWAIGAVWLFGGRKDGDNSTEQRVRPRDNSDVYRQALE